MESVNSRHQAVDRQRHIAHVRHMTNVALGCYTVASLLFVGATAITFVTSQYLVMLAYVPAAVLVYIAEKHIHTMHRAIVGRIGAKDAAMIGAPISVFHLLRVW